MNLASLDLEKLKEKIKSLYSNTDAIICILNELNARRDFVLFDDKMSAEAKIGALVQLRELVNFFNGDLAKTIQQNLEKKLKDSQKEDIKKFDKEKLRMELRKKTLK
jgi:hypothetical protein